MRFRVAVVAASLTLLAAAAGCSATSSDSAGGQNGASVSAAPPPDPCTLVTTDDLERALGESFAQSSLPVTDPGRHTCSYEATETGHHVDVNTYVDPSGGANGVDNAYQNLLQAAKDVGGTPVQLDGIGDAAFRSNSQLYAKMKGYVLNIVIAGLGEDETIDNALEELGRQAASRT